MKGNDPRVDAVVDGLAQGGEFERAAAAEPGLARELELQRWMDAELKELYAYEPRADSTGGPIPIRGVTSRFWKAAAIAATLLIAAAGIWYATVQLSRGKQGPVIGFVRPDQVYAKLVADWVPEEVCTEDDRFAAAVQKRLGSPLVLAAAPDVKALGWTYTGRFRGTIIGPRTMILLTNVGDARVLVLMEQMGSDRKMEEDPAGKLHVFRREVGGLVAYEVTPLAASRVIEHLYDPRAGKPG